MKVTIDIPDIPDEIDRKVKAKAALEEHAIREATIDPYRTWLSAAPGTTAAPAPEEWLAEWVQLGGDTLCNASPGPTATEILAEDRSRLEGR
jgi:hypothetical protein